MVLQYDDKQETVCSPAQLGKTRIAKLLAKESTRHAEPGDYTELIKYRMKGNTSKTLT